MSTNENSDEEKNEPLFPQMQKSVNDGDHACVWTREYGRVTFELRSKQREVDDLKEKLDTTVRHLEAADAKKNKMTLNCNRRSANNLCTINECKPCKQQCGMKGSQISQNKLCFK